MSDFNPDYLDTPEKREAIWKAIADERAAEITSLRAELDEAVAMVNEMDAADVARFQSIEADIDAWHEGELAAGRDVPEVWDECRTSEGLASHLTALGYARTTVPPTTDT